MKLSTRSQYGLQLMLELALQYNKNPVGLSAISKGRGLSEKYLGQIIIPLKSAGLVYSQRGANGGYALLKSPREITVREIVEVLEGGLVLVDKTKHRPDINRDVVNNVWEQLEKSMIDILETITLDGLINNYKQRLEMGVYSI